MLRVFFPPWKLTTPSINYIFRLLAHGIDYALDIQYGMSKLPTVEGQRAYRDQRSSSAPNVNQVVYNGGGGGGGGNERMNLEVYILYIYIVIYCSIYSSIFLKVKIFFSFHSDLSALFAGGR